MATDKQVGFCTSPRFIEHDTGFSHPERPDRIRAIHRAVREAGLVRSPDPFPAFSIDLGIKPIDAAPVVELEPSPTDLRWIEQVHSTSYINHIRRVCEAGGGVIDQGDTPVCPVSYETALLSCGALLTCCDAVMTGQVARAFSTGRPPGHHAEPDRPMGFCLFSNVAIAAKYLQRQYGIAKVAIVDFDVHHGNGTQACSEEDPSVLFISLHQDPRTLYPGSGYEWEIGRGAGEGTTLNITFPPGAEDDAYLLAFEQKVIPNLNAFAPDVLLISAGFDGHREDPLAQINLSEECFEQMTRLLCRFADDRCGGRVVSALEGGYNLRALGRSVVRHLVGMM